jgi:hypothetical protein
MKNFTRILFFVFLMLTVSVYLNAQVTVIGHITAEVVSPLTATETSQLSFGKFSPETSGGEIVLTPKGTASSTGTVSPISGTHNPGCFFISGIPDAIISMQLPSGPTTLTNSANTGTMTVTGWRSDPPQESNLTISSSGARAVTIGATLIVGNIQNNPVGMYTGTYNITFNYN